LKITMWLNKKQQYKTISIILQVSNIIEISFQVNNIQMPSWLSFSKHNPVSWCLIQRWPLVSS